MISAAVSKEEKPGVNGRSQVIVASVTWFPRFYAASQAFGSNVVQLRESEKEVAVCALQSFAVQPKDRGVRVFEKSFGQIEPAQDGAGFEAGLGAADCVFVGLAVGNRERRFVRPYGGGAAGLGQAGREGQKLDRRYAGC